MLSEECGGWCIKVVRLIATRPWSCSSLRLVTPLQPILSAFLRPRSSGGVSFAENGCASAGRPFGSGAQRRLQHRSERERPIGVSSQHRLNSQAPLKDTKKPRPTQPERGSSLRRQVKETLGA
jgi:hypothetical protein